MRSRVTYATLVVLLICGMGVATGGCEPGESAEPARMRDDLGRTVAVPRPVERVVTFAPSLTEMVYAAGAGRKLVGVGFPDDHPPAVESLARFSTYPIDFEAVAALEPDLALATDQVNSPRDAETLQGLGIPTYFLSFQSLENVFSGLIAIGNVLGTSAAAEHAVDSLRRELQDIRTRTSSAHSRPTVLVLIGPETLFSFGGESYVHEMVDAAGGRSLTAGLDVRAPVLSEEYVLRRAPDVILGPWGNDVDAAELLQHHPSWTAVPAIRDGRVYGIDGSLIERPGPRLVAGIRELARRLHPLLFEGDGTHAP